ncbi:MAG: hypothetical protein NT118_02435 [Lentisphaerae bacterium]|nr:hypothetical protein [Lentisphaerota bacterium]
MNWQLHVLSTADAAAGKFEDSIPKALKKIEDDVALFAWRCRVIETAVTRNIINRGRLDGVRSGDEFQGYKIDSQGKQNDTMPEELLIMKSGVKTGKYKVVEEGQQFSKVEPVGDAPLLSAGDFLEQPDIWLKDRNRESRGRRTWDKIYDKQ